MSIFKIFSGKKKEAGKNNEAENNEIEIKYDGQHGGLLGTIKQALEKIIVGENAYVKYMSLKNKNGRKISVLFEKQSLEPLEDRIYSCKIEFPGNALKIEELLANTLGVFEIGCIYLELDVDLDAHSDAELTLRKRNAGYEVEFKTPRPIINDKKETLCGLLDKLKIDYKIEEGRFIATQPAQDISLGEFFSNLAERSKIIYMLRCHEGKFSCDNGLGLLYWPDSASTVEIVKPDQAALERLVELYESLTGEEMPKAWELTYASQEKR